MKYSIAITQIILFFGTLCANLSLGYSCPLNWVYTLYEADSGGKLGYLESQRLSEVMATSVVRDLNATIATEELQGRKWLRAMDDSGRFVSPFGTNPEALVGRRIVGTLTIDLPKIEQLEEKTLILPFEGTVSAVESRLYNVNGGTYPRAFSVLVINTDVPHLQPEVKYYYRPGIQNGTGVFVPTSIEFSRDRTLILPIAGDMDSFKYSMHSDLPARRNFQGLKLRSVFILP